MPRSDGPEPGTAAAGSGTAGAPAVTAQSGTADAPAGDARSGAAGASAATAPPGAADAPAVTAHGHITEAQAQAALRLVQAATDADGVGPLSEHVMLHLRYGGDPRARNLLLVSHGELAGYAHLDPANPADLAEGPSGELVIHPAYRGQGLGLLLTRALIAEAGPGPLRLWAHGDLPGAVALAAAAGFERVRALWQMRRSLRSPLERPQIAEGVTIRTFVVGQDEDAWIDLNSRAFASHPEQGAWTREDLDLREREPWFDPNGFFLAERDGKLVGFHWTKIHGAADPVPGGGAAARTHETHEEARGAHEAIGEVYVVGVDPDQRGLRLGRALTVVGLDYLRSEGLSQVMLYVDESNAPAIKLYQSLGFTRWHTDVMFARQPDQLKPPPGSA
jgi:mycothiol synthase